jgi:flavorubredoxin
MSLFELDLSKPVPRQAPLEVAPDTFVIRALTHSVGGTWTNLNSMVIRAAEPVIVDTGMVTNRATWFEDVFSLVPPDEVRWIFVTHNDSDHSGNLVEALERCPNASVVSSNGESFRTVASFGIPPERIRKVDNGQTFDVGDRTLLAVRPPVYDSPYTRGLFDPTTRVYYASDAFCAPMPPEPVDWVEEIPELMWAESMAKFHHISLCPWISLVDQARFKVEVDKLAAIGIDVIAGAHTPAIRGSAVPRAFEQLAKLPSTVPANTL